METGEHPLGAVVSRVLYTGGNMQEVRQLCGDKLLAPYFCMGFSILSILTDDGIVTIDEGDTVVRDDDGRLHVDKWIRS